jgi:hypothetical protein
MRVKMSGAIIKFALFAAYRPVYEHVIKPQQSRASLAMGGNW